LCERHRLVFPSHCTSVSYVGVYVIEQESLSIEIELRVISGDEETNSMSGLGEPVAIEGCVSERKLDSQTSAVNAVATDDALEREITSQIVFCEFESQAPLSLVQLLLEFIMPNDAFSIVLPGHAAYTARWQIISK
jgi:hypothetical protein